MKNPFFLSFFINVFDVIIFGLLCHCCRRHHHHHLQSTLFRIQGTARKIGGTNRHTEPTMDIAAYRVTWPRGKFSENWFRGYGGKSVTMPSNMYISICMTEY